MVRRILRSLLLVSLLATALAGQESGAITGSVVSQSGAGVGGVAVVLNELSRATMTDPHGAFRFDRVPPGTYSLTFAVGERSETRGEVRVRSGEVTEVRQQVGWAISFADSITVYSASRKTERIVEAPAAVTVVSEEELTLLSPTGQLPKAIESAPGVDFTQSGLYDFNFNTRGFNSSLNRRILTLLDGRDPSVPFLGAQEWAALSYPVDEMASVELVRGPGSALYGANAFNGVLNMVTKQPRYTQGGKLQFSGGDLDTTRVDLRHAGTLGADSYFRVVAGWQQGEDFTRSRNASKEYGAQMPCAGGTFNCLPGEISPLALDEVQIGFGALRFDRYFTTDRVLTLEAGTASLEGPTFLTGIGRVQVTDVERPWARINFNTPRVNLMAYYDARNADDQVALASGARLFEDSSNVRGELQVNQSFAGDRVRLVGGVSYNQQDVDTSNPAGQHTLMAEAHDEDQQAVFGQAELNATDRLKFVFAARWDDSTLHEAQFSPKASLVFSMTPNHTIRLNYNEAFQVPNYSEFFLTAPAGAPLNLSAIEDALRPFLGPVSLGFASVPLLARGNPALEVEEITSYEIGYSGILADRLYVTVDYYENEVSNFVTDLLPGVNPQWAPYAPPSVLPPPVQAAIRDTLRTVLPPAVFAGMTNLPNGQPAVVFSYTNAGAVDAQGVEVAFNFYVNEHWVLDANYSWFDFEVTEATAAGDRLLPNAPENKYNLGVTYRHPAFDLALKYRHVDEFDWATGVFFGTVPSYDVVNLSANYNLSQRWRIGASVSNLTDEKHWESFGGDILERRALGFVSYAW